MNNINNLNAFIYLFIDKFFLYVNKKSYYII